MNFGDPPLCVGIFASRGQVARVEPPSLGIPHRARRTGGAGGRPSRRGAASPTPRPARSSGERGSWTRALAPAARTSPPRVSRLRTLQGLICLGVP